MKNIIIPVVLLLCLTGCLSPKGAQENHTAISPPIINLPPPQQVDTSKLESRVDGIKQDLSNEIQASSNNTQNQLSGFVNASVSKLAEKLTGVEANLKDLLTVNATMTNTLNASANTEIKAKLEASIKLVSEINSQISINNQMTASLNSEFKASITAMNEMKLELGKLALNAQAGIANKIQDIQTTIDSKAGRDVNYLPKEAVYIVVSTLALVAFVFLITVIVVGINSRRREEQRTISERENVARWQAIALEAISGLEPEKAKHFRSLLMENKHG
jgi:hypothetical protein